MGSFGPSPDCYCFDQTTSRNLKPARGDHDDHAHSDCRLVCGVKMLPSRPASGNLPWQARAGYLSSRKPLWPRLSPRVLPAAERGRGCHRPPQHRGEGFGTNWHTSFAPPQVGRGGSPHCPSLNISSTRPRAVTKAGDGRQEAAATSSSSLHSRRRRALSGGTRTPAKGAERAVKSSAAAKVRNPVLAVPALRASAARAPEPPAPLLPHISCTPMAGCAAAQHVSGKRAH